MKIKFRISNFRSIKNAELELALTTFLLGPNGAGKSTIYKALKFLGLNLNNHGKVSKTVFNLDANDHLGGYKDIVYENNTNKDIVLNFDIECHYKEFDHYVDYVWFFDQGSENLNDPNDKDLQTDGSRLGNLGYL